MAWIAVLLVAAGLTGAAPTFSAVPASGPAAEPAALVAVGYSPPVRPLTVLTPFSPPLDRYGAGHLGVDLAASQGAPVAAADAGVVSFAGLVAGRGVVVIVHADGIRTEYEPVAWTVSRGTTVARGQLIGTVSGGHASCAPNSCLHWGARRGEEYLDPLSLLRRLGPVRLLPWR